MNTAISSFVDRLGLNQDGMNGAILELLKTGRLLPLPCPIGSTVYVIGHKYRAGRDEWWINPGKFRPSDLEKIGTRVFLSMEDAEKTLEERKNSAK